jgi:trimeric autotransporter adhesin
LGANSTPSGPLYLFSPAGFTIASGTYSLTGNGGSQVGPFSVSTNFQSDFTVTNLDSVTAIDRSQPLTFNWTGSGFDQVVILASTGTVTGANQHLVTITCTVPGSLGSYSVPTAALAYLQPAPTSTSFGTVTVTALSTPVPFTAALAAGGQTDIAGFGTSFAVAGKTNIPVR